MQQMLRGALALSLSLGWVGMAWAESCPSGYVLQPIGSATTTSSQLTNNGAAVRLVTGVCTSTACTVTLYDEDGIRTNTAAGSADGSQAEETLEDVEAKLEVGAAASGFFQWPSDGFAEVPITFLNGVYAYGNGNMQGVVAYECTPVPR